MIPKHADRPADPASLARFEAKHRGESVEVAA